MVVKRGIRLCGLAAVLGVFGYAHVPTLVIPEGVTADSLVVHKHDRTLLVYAEGMLVKTLPGSLGFEINNKQKEGDGRTPEGRYRIVGRNPQSGYHRALRISYPSADDQRVAQAHGQNPGGDMMIHGLRNGFGWIGRWHRVADWPAGCMAVTNREIKELWQAVPDGIPVIIKT